MYVHVDAPEASHLCLLYMCTPVGTLRRCEGGLFGENYEPRRVRLGRPRRGVQRGGCWALRQQCCARLAGWCLMLCQAPLPRWWSSNTGWSVSVPALYPPPIQTTVLWVCVFTHTSYCNFSPFISRFSSPSPALISTLQVMTAFER